MARLVGFLPLFAAVALALGLLMLTGRDSSRPISLCIGGCAIKPSKYESLSR